ncbi:pre-mRNA cleavage and polyadenylation factor (CPF) complex subunit [Malassezia cuniculi]|uniref:Polyadenylation factor subunit 2 n=1 Tax=Malassezia cuniculi TaxID=948313 RepID=A0AAF0EXU4_9BASI|nr:pre-mRNA cleavage and polyadenylation factor (CPF) complex subunit [Malassezia cuniculi]
MSISVVAPAPGAEVVQSAQENVPTRTPRWRPTKYKDAPRPPVPDTIDLEEAAATATAIAAGYEGRKVRRYLHRRTIDYWATVPQLERVRRNRGTVRNDVFLRPSPHQVIGLLPPAGYIESATSVAPVLVHTSTNKIRCPVNVVRWLPEGRRLVTGSTSGEFTLWNALTFNFETILQAHESAVRAMEWSNSGAWLVSADQNGQIKYFQSNMNNLQAFVGHHDAIRDLSFAPDDQRFITASDDSTLRIWRFDEAQEESTLKGHGWEVKCVDWHPTQALIVSGSKDNLVKFWDPRFGTDLGTYHGHKNTVQACKWHAGGNLVATASRDQSIKVYDIRAMNELYTLRGQAKEVCSLDWHPIHHDLLVSGGSEGAMQYWSLRAPNPEEAIHTVEDAHESNVWSIQWHPFGHLLCSGSNDHTTRFWSRTRPGELVEGAGDDERWEPTTTWDDEVIPGLTGHASGSREADDHIPGIGSSRAEPEPALEVEAPARWGRSEQRDQRDEAPKRERPSDSRPKWGRNAAQEHASAPAPAPTQAPMPAPMHAQIPAMAPQHVQAAPLAAAHAPAYPQTMAQHPPSYGQGPYGQAPAYGGAQYGTHYNAPGQYGAADAYGAPGPYGGGAPGAFGGAGPYSGAPTPYGAPGPYGAYGAPAAPSYGSGPYGAQQHQAQSGRPRDGRRGGQKRNRTKPGGWY